MKKTVFLFYGIFFFCLLQAQEENPIKNITKKIKHHNKALAEELGWLKKIEGKTFISQQYEGTDSLSFYLPSRVSLSALYISPYELTNKQYLEFTDFVQDSIARTLMGYFTKTHSLDYAKNIDWNDKLTLEKLNSLFLSPDNRIFNRLEIDPEKILYAYAVEKNAVMDLPVLPDTLCWIKEYAYAYNEPMTSRYFRHPAFYNYPVVGVSYYQAMAFCHWKTRQLQNLLPADFPYEVRFDLPTAVEWEAAATIPTPATAVLGNNTKMEKMNKQSGQFANKPVQSFEKKYIPLDCNYFSIKDANGYTIKEPADDGALYTAKVDNYEKDKNGLYNMRGNVAEWTSTNGNAAYESLKEYFTENSTTALQMQEELKTAYPTATIWQTGYPEFLARMKAWKIVKGGSWSSTPFYLQPGIHQFAIPFSSSSNIGFRYVVYITRKN